MSDPRTDPLRLSVTLVSNAELTSGVGKPADGLRRALQAHGHEVSFVELNARTSSVAVNGVTLNRLWRTPFGGKPLFWLRAAPQVPIPKTGIFHLTNQTLSFLALRLPARSVVTVWDLIELENPQVRFGRPLAHLLYRGIPHAAHILTPSQVTAEAVTAHYHVPSERVTVVPPAIPETFTYDPDLLASPRGRAFMARHNLIGRPPLVLYVGSEHPRKNITRLLGAIKILLPKLPEIRFVKVGAAGTKTGRSAFMAALENTGLRTRTEIVEESGDENLRFWYHAASVLAFPSLAEGFGFPPLEAMACGTPVVTSNRSSLPEVVGDAAVLVDPGEPESIAQGLLSALDGSRRAELRARGLKRAARFTLEQTLRNTEEIYRRVLA